MAHVDFFLKIDGIEGESTDNKHKNEIDVESWSWGQSNGGDAAHRGGMGAGKVAMQDFHFTMALCKATPKLIKACATGQHIKEATLTCRKAGGEQQEYLKIKFSDFIVSSYQTGGSTSSVKPIDQISLNFSKIEVEYKAQNEKGQVTGSVKAGYDLKANKEI